MERNQPSSSPRDLTKTSHGLFSSTHPVSSSEDFVRIIRDILASCSAIAMNAMKAFPVWMAEVNRKREAEGKEPKSFEHDALHSFIREYITDIKTTLEKDEEVCASAGASARLEVSDEEPSAVASRLKPQRASVEDLDSIVADTKSMKSIYVEYEDCVRQVFNFLNSDETLVLEQVTALFEAHDMSWDKLKIPNSELSAFIKECKKWEVDQHRKYAVADFMRQILMVYQLILDQVSIPTLNASDLSVKMEADQQLPNGELVKIIAACVCSRFTEDDCFINEMLESDVPELETVIRVPKHEFRRSNESLLAARREAQRARSQLAVAQNRCCQPWVALLGIGACLGLIAGGVTIEMSPPFIESLKAQNFSEPNIALLIFGVGLGGGALLGLLVYSLWSWLCRTNDAAHEGARILPAPTVPGGGYSTF